MMAQTFSARRVLGTLPLYFAEWVRVYTSAAWNPVVVVVSRLDGGAEQHCLGGLDAPPSAADAQPWKRDADD